jgi:hypothetical protein
MAKECTPTNCDTDQRTLEGYRYITYPFPRPQPLPDALHAHAVTTNTLFECDPADGLECSPPFNDLLNSKDDMAFVDARGDTVNLEGNALKGILVVWCGHLVQRSGPMQGVILNLSGNGLDFGASNCEGDGTKGTYEHMGLETLPNGQQKSVEFAGWLYAQGGTPEMAGIHLHPGSEVQKFPGGKWNFEMDAFANTPPNAFSLRGWRELYQ